MSPSAVRSTVVAAALLLALAFAGVVRNGGVAVHVLPARVTATDEPVRLDCNVTQCSPRYAASVTGGRLVTATSSVGPIRNEQPAGVVDLVVRPERADGSLAPAGETVARLRAVLTVRNASDDTLLIPDGRLVLEVRRGSKSETKVSDSGASELGPGQAREASFDVAVVGDGTYEMHGGPSAHR